MEYLIEYGMFLAKTATLVAAFIILLAAIISVSTRSRRQAAGKGSISVTRLNDELDDMRDAMKKVVYDKATFKHEQKQEKKRIKEEEREHKRQLKSEITDVEAEEHIKKRVYVIDFDGDIEASAVDSLREEITAVLSLATPKDEIVLRLESPGGMVHAYGLASSQLLRIK